MHATLHLPDGRELSLDRPRIMGILNVTPDSFSDGGMWVDVDAAAAHALRMVDEGADVIDVGGESTRPGSQRIAADEQRRRVVDVIRRAREALDEAGLGRVVISIDTTLAAVAEAALDAGAAMINDISAGREDGQMLALAAGRGVPIVLMHMRGEPGTMQDQPCYGDVVGEVEAFLLERAAAAAGVAAGQIVIDPGIGFGKTLEHNLALLAAMPRFVATGMAVMVGASRKRFIAALSAAADAEDRLGGTCAVTALATAAGVQMLRVHDVAANVQAAVVAAAIKAVSAGQRQKFQESSRSA
jgi:dihydropteroate synthase